MAEVNAKISGMHCASCALNIEHKLKKIKGIYSVSVSYANESASLNISDPASLSEKVKKAVESLGYTIHLGDSVEEYEKEQHKINKNTQVKLKVSILLTSLLMIGSMIKIPYLSSGLTLFILATPIQFWVGSRFYKSAWAALKNKTTNMDTLIALGTSVAYWYSVVVLIWPGLFPEMHYYFEVSSSIITLVLLGKFLEEKAKSSTTSALKKLIGLQPKKALLVKGNKTITVDLSEVKKGDYLIVKAGDKIPVDAKVVEGESSIDESMITGESVPVDKVAGDKVTGGTINLSGSLKIKATSVGEDTVLSHIIKLVRQAQGSKAPVQKLVDKISSIFVPTVLVLSIITFSLWYAYGPEPVLTNALMMATAVLIIACPCALGLATPTSIMVATGRAAESGFLIKDASTLEQAGKATHVLFDKTGTLTIGKPILHDYKLAPKEPESTLSAIKSIELQSSHPLAKTLSSSIEAKTIKVTNVKETAGIGISAKAGNNHFQIGSAKILDSKEVKASDSLIKYASLKATKGMTIVHVLKNKKHVAVFALSDEVREGAKEMLEELRELGIQPIMITGDNKQSANYIASKLGITEFHAETMPDEKNKIVKKYLSPENVVVMVGDGINDAPALAVADIAVAMGQGTDVAMETAGVTVLGSRVSILPRIFSLSKATMRNIKENLAWAFGYNVTLIPVAMGALYPLWGVRLSPMLGAAAMALSSVSVVTNSLRLKNWGKKEKS